MSWFQFPLAIAIFVCALSNLSIGLETDAIDPSSDLARWHSGEVKLNGEWLAIDDYENQMANDEQLAEYRRQREEVTNGFRSELKLAGWCRRQKLHDAERLHLTRVVRNPASSVADRNQAMQRLGLRMYRGKALTEKEITELEMSRQLAKQHDEHWTPIVKGWRNSIEQGGKKRRFALGKLQELRDPRAIPTLERLLSKRSEGLALKVVAVLVEMPEFAATKSLVGHSVQLPWQSVRKAAVDQLKQRTLHDYVPLLMSELSAPLQTRFRVSVDADGMVRRAHQVFREGEDANVLFTNISARSPLSLNQSVNVGVRGGGVISMPISEWRLRGSIRDLGRTVSTRRLGRDSQERLKEQIEAVQAQADLQRELALEQQRIAREEARFASQVEQNLARANQQIGRQNETVMSVLSATTSADLASHSPNDWWQWWSDHNDVYQAEKPTFAYTSVRSDPTRSYYVPPPHECFAATTLVRTQTGLVPIESLRAGDRVLSQEVDTGELAYKLVLGRTVRPPHDLLNVTVGEEMITATAGHPFWVNNVGWRMAKQLEAGQLVHTADGSKKVGSLTTADPEPAYNLIVADFGTYFVGEEGILVHDNTDRNPTLAATPGVLKSDDAAVAKEEGPLVAEPQDDDAWPVRRVSRR